MTFETGPEVVGPNNRPTPSEFDTSEVIYGDGFPNIPEPEWLKGEAKRMKSERDDLATDEPKPVESGRLRTFMSAIESDFYWHGQITDSDYRDRQNGITPPFEP